MWLISSIDDIENRAIIGYGIIQLILITYKDLVYKLNSEIEGRRNVSSIFKEFQIELNNIGLFSIVLDDRYLVIESVNVKTIGIRAAGESFGLGTGVHFNIANYSDIESVDDVKRHLSSSFGS